LFQEQKLLVSASKTKRKGKQLRIMTSLSTKLAEREASGKPIQIGLVGAGKFGSMLYVHNPPTRIGLARWKQPTNGNDTASHKSTAPPACA